MIEPSHTAGQIIFLRFLADLVLITHVSFVLFVTIGLLLTLIGGFRKWEWVRNPGFRLAHLLGIGIVVTQAWLGIICPLTILEMWLRREAGAETYQGTFISHWLQKLLYYHAPPWVFIVAYTAFGIAVLASWILIRPRSFRRVQ